ncbi:MAG: NUDIX domain-containing protein [Micropepsaceae bacterium]
MLGGMLELPSSPWGPAPAEPLSYAPQKAAWKRAAQPVEHVFTHFRLTLDVYAARVPSEQAEGIWLPLGELETAGLPSVMRKVAAAGLAALGMDGLRGG